MSPARRRQAVARAMTAFEVSERRACRAVGVSEEAHHSLRMQRDFQRIGEAAGYAASVMVKSGTAIATSILPRNFSAPRLRSGR